MNARSLSQLTTIALVALGTVFVLLRGSAREAYQSAQENSLWRLTYEVAFKMVGDNADDVARLDVAVPSPLPPAELVIAEFTAPELEEASWVGAQTGTRERRFIGRHPKEYRVTAKFHINARSKSSSDGPAPMENLSPDARSMFLRPQSDVPVLGPRVQDMAQAIPDSLRTVEERIEWIFDACLGLQATTPEEGGTDVEMALATGQASPLGRVKCFVAICRAAKIPARLVTGFELRRVESPKPHVWAEVFRNNRWVPFDPEYGFARKMPSSFVPARRGGGTIVEPVGSEVTSERYTIERLPPSAELLQHDARRPLQIFDLTRLPLEMHEVLKLVLLLPLGALITAFFRNMIGIRTFGTFAPSLLAMSFIYAAFGTGLVLLIVAVLAGLAGRTLIERLHLLMIPRLSFVLTLIILCMVFGVSFVDYMAHTPQPQAVLLPLVILTIIIERFYVTSEEDGFPFAVQLAVGTLVVAAFCYLLLKWDDIGQWILIYPEAHLFTLAAFVFIGRYTGYRITELWRFRDVINNQPEPVMKQDGIRFWAWPDELRKAGVLGINRRNVEYILKSNPRGLYPRVDDKLITKQICQEHGIPVPETYGVLIQQSHVKRFPEIIADRQEFVIKPANGAAGRGIVVIARRRGDDYITPSRRVISWSDLRYHIATSLSGLYSLGGQVDKVIVEKRIISHEALHTVAVGGTPDIRVILYRGVPAMAMIRLPTRDSGGRANLHQGAVAAAIDLMTGKTFGGVMENRVITHHPDTEMPIAGIEIPNWRHLMDSAMRLSDALKLGYVGVDFVIDATQGPVVLEANARPGLAIQVAHGQGITPRLAAIDAAAPAVRHGQRRWELIESIGAQGAA